MRPQKVWRVRKMNRTFVFVILLAVAMSCIPLASAGLGSPQLSVSVSVSPSTTLQWGDTATLTVTVKETGGEDWANDVTVTPVVPQGSKITISPSKSQPKDIKENGYATFTFTIRVPEYEEPGTKTITLLIDYGDTGAGDIGEWRYTIKRYVTLTIKKPPATLVVETTPDGASVYINDDYKGTTPLTLTLEDGTYDLKITKDGYETIQETITLYPGKTITITRELKPLPATLIIKTVGNERAILAGLGAVIIMGILVVISRKKRARKDKKTVKEAKELFPSQLLKKYEPLEFLGEGGFAKVFKAKRKSDGKIVAVKIPRIDESTSKVFLREVGTWLHLDHPNIVKLYEADILPIPHLEMEFVEGVDLNGKTIRSLEEYPKPTEEGLALKFTKGITQAVKYAHSQNVLHRDIKPSNILLKHDLTPKLTDWGLSKIGVTTSSKTAAGYTPLYAAPEQLLPSQYGHTDYRTDLYQIGAVLYELLTGRPPYEGHSPEELIGKITDPDYIPKKPSEVNPELYIFDSFFEKALAKRKEDRYQSVDEFLRDLEKLEEAERRKAELETEVQELKKTLSQSISAMKKSTTPEEIRRNRLVVVETLGRLALAYAQLNDRAELLNTLNDLKFYTTRNLEDLGRAIETVEALIKEGLPVSEDFIERLRVLVHDIERENRM